MPQRPLCNGRKRFDDDNRLSGLDPGLGELVAARRKRFDDDNRLSVAAGTVLPSSSGSRKRFDDDNRLSEASRDLARVSNTSCRKRFGDSDRFVSASCAGDNLCYVPQVTPKLARRSIKAHPLRGLEHSRTLIVGHANVIGCGVTGTASAS